MKKIINDSGKEAWESVELNDAFLDFTFYEVDMSSLPDDFQHALHTNLGSLTVLDRLTGFEGYVRDVETGFRDCDGNFWLASGDFDIRDYNPETIGDAIIAIKKNANTCIPDICEASL